MPLRRMKRLLHTCEVPERLPCREKEFEKICLFIRDCVKKNGFSQVMYLSGVPGTGKTATVIQVATFSQFWRIFLRSSILNIVFAFVLEAC